MELQIMGRKKVVCDLLNVRPDVSEPPQAVAPYISDYNNLLLAARAVVREYDNAAQVNLAHRIKELRKALAAFE